MEKPQHVLSRLDELIQARSILKHPFYIAWEQGELSREQLAIYAESYYPHVAAFPGYLKSAIETAGDDVVRTELEINLEDELSKPKPHSELWLDFAGGLGLDRDRVAGSKAKPGTEKAVRQFRHLAKSETVIALAALYSYESQQPEVSRKKVDGLRKHYGIDSPKALAYFEVHAETDVFHRQGERNALSYCLAKGASHESMLSAADQGLSSYWGLLDGICIEAGIQC